MSAIVYTIENTGSYKRVLVENPIATKFDTAVVYKIYLGKHLLGYQVEIGTRKTTGDVSLDIKRALITAEDAETALRKKMKSFVAEEQDTEE